MDKGAEEYRRFLDGDNEAMREIIDAYYKGLTFYLNSYLRDLGKAEEAAEDVFVELVTKKPEFSGKSEFRTWLYSIGRYLTLDRIRRESKRKTTALDEISDTTADDREVESEIVADEEKKHLHEAMKRLKTEYRQVLFLTYFEEMTAKEAAQVMRRSTVSVEHLIRRAKTALKKEFGKG